MTTRRAGIITASCILGLAGLYAAYAYLLEPAEPDMAALAGTETLDWSDLIPPEQDNEGVKLRDGSLARGVVGHGGLLPKGDSPLADAAVAPSPHELATMLGAINSLDGPPRRLSDTFGGIGNLRGLQPRGAKIRVDLDGKVVRIAGFVTPMGFEGSKITEFLLVPFVGACIHVPPPPANQIVYVAGFGAYRADGGLLYPVWVTGTLRAQPLETGLADVGYRLEGARVTRYE